MSPSTRSTVPSDPGKRAMVRDIGSGASLPAAFDVRTAYDFAISLSSDVGQHEELPAEDRRWLERARAALPPPLHQTMTEETCVHAVTLIVDRPDITDAAGVVELLEQTSGKTFAHMVLGDSMHDPGRRAEVVAALTDLAWTGLAPVLSPAESPAESPDIPDTPASTPAEEASRVR